jgi:hypothetical protein
MASGRVWIGRGNGLRLEVSIMLRGEPFPINEFQELLNSLLEAPVSGSAH